MNDDQEIEITYILNDKQFSREENLQLDRNKVKMKFSEKLHQFQEEEKLGKKYLRNLYI